MNSIRNLKEYIFGQIDIDNENVIRLLISLSIPSILAVVVNNLNQIINSILVGKVIGEGAIAAVAIVSPFIGILITVSMMVSTGGMSILSRSLGEKNIEKAKICFANSITLTVVLSIILSIGGYIFLDGILSLLGAKGDILLLSKSYLRIFLIGMIFMALAFIFGNLLRAEGKSKESMMILVIGSISNIFLGYVFILVFNFGIEGAAWATTIANLLSFVYGLLKIIKGSSIIELRWKYLKLDLGIVKEIISIGLSSFISQGAGNLGTVIANRVMINVGGTELITAIGIFGMVQSLIFMPISGVTQGMQPILGYNYGADRIDKVQTVVKLTLKYVFIIALVNSVLALIFTWQVAGLFIKSDNSVLAYAVPNIRIGIMFAAFGAQQWVGGTVFRAIGMAKKAYFFSILRMIIIFTPLIIILGYTLGPIGCWLSHVFSDLVSGIVSKRYLLKYVSRLKIEKLEMVS